jgi:NitT/TauT family transport system substrate-binding protein
MIRKTKWLILALAVAALFAASACGGDDDDKAPDNPGGSGAASPTARTEPVTLHLGYFANITHAPGLVGVRDGTFKSELGDLVKLDVKTFNAGPAEIEALFAGEIDIAYVGPNPAINGYVQSNGDALRIIGGATSGGALLVIRPDAGINSPKDFANKKVATPQLGNTQDVALRAWLQNNGLKAKEQGGNVNVLPTDNATTLTLFQKGEIDAAWVPEPWATRLVQQGGGKVFLDEKTLWPNSQFVTTVIVARTEFLKKNPDVVESFLRANVKVIQAMQADPEKAKATTNDAIKDITQQTLSKDVIDAAWKNLDFTWDPLADSLKTSSDNAYALGFLGLKKPDLSKIYDLTMLNKVLTDLKLTPAKGF